MSHLCIHSLLLCLHPGWLSLHPLPWVTKWRINSSTHPCILSLLGYSCLGPWVRFTSLFKLLMMLFPLVIIQCLELSLWLVVADSLVLFSSNDCFLGFWFWMLSVYAGVHSDSLSLKPDHLITLNLFWNLPQLLLLLMPLLHLLTKLCHDRLRVYLCWYSHLHIILTHIILPSMHGGRVLNHLLQCLICSHYIQWAIILDLSLTFQNGPTLISELSHVLYTKLVIQYFWVHLQI